MHSKDMEGEEEEDPEKAGENEKDDKARIMDTCVLPFCWWSGAFESGAF